MDWIRRCDIEIVEQFLMWLTGAAGAGKSAIMQSLIEACLEHNVVITAFFFDRYDGTRNHTGSLIATLVYQIYHSVPAAQSYILSAIDADPLIFTKNMEHQFSRLIIKPLDIVCSGSSTSWIPGSYCAIAIDGLDECIDSEEQLQLLSIISNAIRQAKLPILFLIASRPEHEIRSAFTSNEMDDICIPLFLDETYKPDDDIRIFLKDNFHKIKTTHPYRKDIPEIWPSPETLEALVKKSSGQFIYAATVIRYVQSRRHRPDHRLEIVMKVRPPQGLGDRPFAQLDALYTMILSSAEEVEPERMGRILYALSLYSHQVFDDSRHDICEFMSLEEQEIDILLCDLGSLLSIEATPGPKETDKQVKTLRILHASLHDFLLDLERSGKYHIAIDAYRTQHLANILQYISLAICLYLYDFLCSWRLLNHAFSDDNDHVYVESRFKAVSGFFRRESSLCRQSSPDLLQRATSFPLVEILHKIGHDQSPSFFLFFDLFPFIRQMVNDCQSVPCSLS